MIPARGRALRVAARCQPLGDSGYLGDSCVFPQVALLGRGSYPLSVVVACSSQGFSVSATGGFAPTDEAVCRRELQDAARASPVSLPPMCRERADMSVQSAACSSQSSEVSATWGFAARFEAVSRWELQDAGCDDARVARRGSGAAFKGGGSFDATGVRA